MQPMIALQDLTLAYDRHPAVHHLSGAFAKGSLTAVIGPNGAGKSSLLQALAGLKKPAEGKMLFDGIARHDVSYLPQYQAIDETFPISVLDVIQMGHWHRVGPFRAINKALHQQSHAALSSVGLDGFADRAFGSLSVGQRQRVLFARLMVADSRLILLDEPFTAIDTRTTKDLLRLVERWHGEGRTIIAVLHDFEQVRRHFPQALLMARELVAWGATPTVLTSENLLAARAMSEAWDVDADICRGAA
ncbi:MAG TPA: ABC transporter ATP-binding protein [Rhodospirillaceae bacterium]|nr:ABC transporter ATP-binding protein [Rhodospirillaceae bacterium]